MSLANSLRGILDANKLTGKAKVAKKEGLCFYCSKDGHWKKSCKTFLVEKAKMKLEKASGVFMIDLCFSVNMDSTWVLDTRCTSHVCNMLQVLKTHRMLAKGEVDLRMGNEAKVAAVAVGEVNLKLVTGHSLVLDACYYIPSIIKNII